MTARWKEAPGIPGVEVSDDGLLRSWRIRGRQGLRAASPKPLKPTIIGGYARISTTVEGERRNFFVHRIVLAAFVGPCPLNRESRHLNGDRLCNRLRNLRWDTKKANESDKEAHGTHLKGSRSMNAKLSAEKVREIRRSVENGSSLAEMGRRFGVRWQTIQQLIQGRSWKHVK